MTQPHELDHYIGRLSGEGPSHPRQKIVHWLKTSGHGDAIARFSDLYAQAVARHAGKDFVAKDSFASYEAFGHLFGQPGDPVIDGQWADVVGARAS